MALAKIVMNSINKEIDQYAEKVEQVMKQEIHVKSGAARDAITTEKKGEGYFLVGVDAAKLKSDSRNIGGIDYSSFYHDGHGPYTIYPKNAKVLSWIDSKTGQRRFAKYVRMPASAGDPFIKRTVLRRPKLS